MNRLNSRVSTLLKLVEAAPAKTIVQTINAMLGVLRKRGITIVDFEDQRRTVHSLKIFANTAYLLATSPEEDKENGHNQN